MASGESLDVYIYVKPADIQDLTLWNDEGIQRPLDEIGVVGEYRQYNARTSPSSTLKAPGYEDLLIEVGEGVDNYFTMEPIKNYISSLTHKGTTYTIKDAKAREDIATKQDALATQTAYTSKGTATKVPQITTNNLGQVTGITEVTITQPTVNNSTITIQKNGTNVDSFTTNAASGKNINITLSKGDVGLGNVDNTSDLNKPISTATQTALNAKQDVLPTQSGNDGKFLTTNGTTMSWGEVSSIWTYDSTNKILEIS